MALYVLLLIIFLCSSSGVFVVGPKFVRSNEKYSVIISNYFEESSTISLRLLMEGYSTNGNIMFSTTKIISVNKNMNRVENFNVPSNISFKDLKLTIDGLDGFSYHSEEQLVYLRKSMSGLIQINKPIFKLCDMLKFRVIVLDHELKPPARVNSINVTIFDPQKTVVRNWTAARLHTGVFEGDFPITQPSIYGTWTIMVNVEGEEIVTKTFEVKEYVLPPYDVKVTPTVVPLVEHQALNLTVEAKYYFGLRVQGVAKVELYLEDEVLDQVQELNVNGIEQVLLQFNEYLELIDDQRDLRVKITFVERFTNQTVAKDQLITVYKYRYRIALSPGSSYFLRGFPFDCTLVISHHDGRPARNVSVWIDVSGKGFDNNRTYTTEADGTISVLLNPGDSIEEILLIVSQNNNVLFWERIRRKESITDIFLKLQLMSSFNINQNITLKATCNEEMSFLVYYVISKGKIVDAGFEKLSGMKKFILEIYSAEELAPKGTIVVATVLNDTFIWDSLEIDLRQTRNQLLINLNKSKIKAGHEIELRLKGRPGAYVGLAAFDEGLLGFSNQHELFWKDVIDIFDDFHRTDQSEFNIFYVGLFLDIESMGIFVKASGGIQQGNTLVISERSDTDVAISNDSSSMTIVKESWLWKNVTLNNTGRLKLTEVVPNNIASWYLTGFTMDPVYGFGLIKTSIQFTTDKPLYIVDLLPNAIKRGEWVVLQFMLFNSLGSEFIADVTMYNVANQTEFVGRPLADHSYTKSVSVPPNVGVPVSFIVKPRKLGEMAVRVEASIMLGLETDALEKVIRVMPESLVQPKMVSRFFCFDIYTNQTFVMPLHIDKKAESGSVKIEFQLNPNLLTTVLDNLDNLLAVPKGSGEQNMVNFVPNIAVRDYLNAIGSKDQNLIDKATNLLRKGYQNQMRYRQTDGSFSAWGASGSSVFLTAFVAKSIQTASKYISEVDTGIVEKAYDWLASKQLSSGKFDEVGFVIHKDMQGGLRNGVALTSYVLIALLENDNVKVKHAEVIQKGMSYLSSQFNYISNPYDLSIATYAMVLNDHNLKDAALARLFYMFNVIIEINEQNWNSTYGIETAAYALLSFVKAGRSIDGIPIMRWLVSQRYVTGSFPRTQDTFVGLKALTKLAEKISPSRNDYTIRLKYKNNTKQFFLNSQDIYTVSYKDITSDTDIVEINVEGVGVGLLQMIYQYSVNLLNYEKRFNLTIEKQKTGSDHELRLRVCANFIPDLTNSRSNMALIEVNFPSGFVVGDEPVHTTILNEIKHIEVQYGGTSVVVYYTSMGKESNCFIVTALRKLNVTLRRPAYVIAYDFYDRRQNAIEMYEEDSLSDCKGL